MTPHRVPHKPITLASGGDVVIEYWAEGTRIYVAGFDASGKRVSAVSYSAEVDIADEFYGTIKDSVIDHLTKAVEYDLLTNPHMHYRP
jgi:hypothetical protein